jgi:transposase-like protein
MTPRTYTDEFKQGAVDLVKSGTSVLHVAEQLGIPRGRYGTGSMPPG